MPKATPRRTQAQSFRTHVAPQRNRGLQQTREQLELQALNLGAPFDLAQLAADAWLRRVVEAPAPDWAAADQAAAAWLQGVAL